MATYVTGDFHGSIDIGKIAPERWPEGQSLRRSDLLMVCGDFGLIWNSCPPYEDRYFLRWLNDSPWTTLFIDGNHENHDLLDAMEVREWRGGKVHVIPDHPNIIHLMRGQVYDMGVEGRWFCMGGAASHDLSFRCEGNNWWSRELPSAAEYEEARKNLDAVNWSVDYVFTHDCPQCIKPHAMKRHMDEERLEPDELTLFLEEVEAKLDWQRLKRWYFGHYHDDLPIPGDRYGLLYQEVIRLGELPECRPEGWWFS